MEIYEIFLILKKAKNSWNAYKQYLIKQLTTLKFLFIKKERINKKLPITYFLISSAKALSCFNCAELKMGWLK